MFHPSHWLRLSVCPWIPVRDNGVFFYYGNRDSYLLSVRLIYGCNEPSHCVVSFKGQSSHSSVIGWRPSEQLMWLKKRPWGGLSLRSCSRSVALKTTSYILFMVLFCCGFACRCINTVSIYCFSFKDISKAKTGVKWSRRQECNRTAPSSTVRMLNKLC